jgi:hypothetical protein
MLNPERTEILIGINYMMHKNERPDFGKLAEIGISR